MQWDEHFRKRSNNGDGILHGYAVHDFPPGAVLHLLEPDVNQELYGVPEWLPAI